MLESSNPPNHNRYEIEPLAPQLGGGWYVRCYEGDVEVAQGAFPLDAASSETAVDDAHSRALTAGEMWLSLRRESTLNEATQQLTRASDTRTWVGSADS